MVRARPDEKNRCVFSRARHREIGRNAPAQRSPPVRLDRPLDFQALARHPPGTTHASGIDSDYSSQCSHAFPEARAKTRAPPSAGRNFRGWLLASLHDSVIARPGMLWAGCSEKKPRNHQRMPRQTTHATFRCNRQKTTL